MKNSQIKKIENINDNLITYFANSTFSYDTAMQIISTLQQDGNEINTFTVHALLFFGYGHDVLTEDIKNIGECLETFTEYKLDLTEIQYCKFTKEITLLFE